MADQEDIFADFITEEPTPPSKQPPTPAATTPTAAPAVAPVKIIRLEAVSPATAAEPAADQVADQVADQEDIFADFISEEPTPYPSQAVTLPPQKNIELATAVDQAADQVADQVADQEDIFADFITEEPTALPQPTTPPQPTALPQNKTQPIKTPNVNRTKPPAVISGQAVKTVQKVSSPPVSLPESSINDLTLDEVFTQLIAASPAPTTSSDSEDWLEIGDVNPSPSAIAPAQPEPVDEINSSIDNFFAGLDLSTETSQNETLNDSGNQDFSDIDRWISEPNSELNLESDESSKSNLDDFFAQLSDLTSMTSIPSDEDLFG